MKTAVYGHCAIDYKRTVLPRLLFLTALLFIANPQPIFAQDTSKPTVCQYSARVARVMYQSFGNIEREHPDYKRDETAESYRRYIYKEFSEEMAKSDSEYTGTMAELRRASRGQGIKDYLDNSELEPSDYERIYYTRCMSGGSR